MRWEQGTRTDQRNSSVDVHVQLDRNRSIPALRQSGSAVVSATPCSRPPHGHTSVNNAGAEIMSASLGPCSPVDDIFFLGDDRSRLYLAAPLISSLLHPHIPALPAPDIISSTRQCAVQRPICTLISRGGFPSAAISCRASVCCMAVSVDPLVWTALALPA